MANLEIEVNQGKLIGCKFITNTSVEYNAYLGIPYAKPPVGNLRFCAPQPPEPWTGVYDATFFRNVNSQTDRINGNKSIGSEDCLYLNVYVPKKNCKELLPVMFWIHGGGFMSGSGNNDDYGPDYLIEKNIVLVTINYRLGAFGFLCLHTPEVAGNMGMKDQVFALRWVRDNIAKFGGDPNNVTIFGQSAGAASVGYLMVSPMAKGLFHKCIMESGNCLSEWAYQKDPEENLFSLVHNLGYDTNDKYEALEVLRSVSADKIGKITCKPYSVRDRFNLSPVVEKQFDNNECFLPEKPINLIESGNYNKVPCLLGFNSKEGFIFWAKDLCEKPQLDTSDKLNFHIDNVLPKYLINFNKNELSYIIEKIKHFYFSDDLSIDEAFIDVLGDFFALIDHIVFIKKLRKENILYFYNFNVSRKMNKFKKHIDHQFKGAGHGDELSYLFKENTGFNKIDMDDVDLRIIESMTTMWTNFAKFSNPTPNLSNIITEFWEPVKPNQLNYMNIDEELEMRNDLLPKNVEFLENLFTI